MLDKLSPALRHFAILLLMAILTIGLPLLVDHQADLQDWVVKDAHLPIAAAPVVGMLLTALILRLTALTRQYGVGAPDDTVGDHAAGEDGADGP